MTDEPAADGLLGTLLSPLRIPGRVLGDLETIAKAVGSLERTADRRLTSVDDQAGELVAAFGLLQASVDRIEAQVGQLTGLEQTIEAHMEDLRGDLNTRMLAVEAEVHAMRPSMDQVARDVKGIIRLLPDPADGPLARLRDTLTAS